MTLSPTAPKTNGIQITPACNQDYLELTRLWERAVRVTHTFLSEEAIVAIRHDMFDIHLRSVDLFVARFVPETPLSTMNAEGLKATQSCIKKATQAILTDQPCNSETPLCHKDTTSDAPPIPAESILLGFIGLVETHIGMLFIDPDFHRMGVGQLLIHHALRQGATSVDVNEQNPKAHAFYTAMGFIQKGRSSHDSQGNPFPILHLHFAPQ